MLAKTLVGVRFGEGVAAMWVQSPVRQMDFFDGERAKVERGVCELIEPVELFVLTISGVPYTTGAQIVVEVGDTDRFCNATVLVSCAGLNSVFKVQRQMNVKHSNKLFLRF